MASFTTGLSALITSQRALDVVAQNIANANTPGYHRQVARLAARLPVERAGLSIGTGVEITDVRRLRNSLIETAVTQHGSELSQTSAQLDAVRQLETLLSSGEESLISRLEAFFNQLEQLSARPDDATMRRIAVRNAVALTQQFNGLANDFDLAAERLRTQIEGITRQINPIARNIADLNATIQRAELRGVNANDLRDQRDQLINELAEFVGIQAIEQDDGQSTILLAGIPFVIGNRFSELSATVDDQQQAVITLAGSDEPLAITGGTLGGLLSVHNLTLPEFNDRLQGIASALIEQLNKVHATGLSSAAPLTNHNGTNPVSSNSVPLANAELNFPIQAGSLFISVTNLATGSRTLSELAVDPATQSLDDLAAAISAVGNVQAIADPQTRSLRILAASGFSFDFAGRLQSAPSTAAITGSTVPSVAGRYSGTQNDEFTFQVVGTGTVGVTPGLALDVRNSAGTLLATLNIGQGYEPGSAINAPDGVSVALTSGSANNGDSFNVPVVADADTSGILTALGINSFFTGRDAGDIAVRAELVSNPSVLATSRSGAAGDGSNLKRMAAVRDLAMLSGGTQTLSQAVLSAVGDAGARVQELDRVQTSQQILGDRLEAERQSVSGVDPNEELVKMVEFQRAFQLASRYISVVNESLDDLFSII